MPSRERKPPVAIVAALPREVAALVRGARAEAALLRRGVTLYRVDGAVVVAAGMGGERAALAVEAALAAGPVSALISAGLAGACAPELRVGEVVEAGVVVDALTGERFTAAAPVSQVAALVSQVAALGSRVDGPEISMVTLVTAEAIASVREKARLAASYGASLVDMEAATVARLAQAHGLEFRAIKGISDAHDFELKSLARFAGPRGSFRTAAFALHTALRPQEWGKAVQLGRDSSRALMALTAALREVMAASGPREDG